MFKSVAQDLLRLEPLFVEYLKTPNEPTNQIIAHIFESGGKRLRPALFFLVCKLIGYNGEFKFPIAGVCEYIHTASLLHDDVIDNSSMRRNKPTVNSVWGDETAVLSGDLIYSAACRLMVKTRSLDLIDTFAECIRFMSESELFQLELLWKPDVSESQYFRVVHGKTACLFEACSKTPAFLAHLSIEESTLLGKIGFHLGMAFQITDDCLDFEGEVSAVGKALEADLKEGKTTLPLIYGIQKSSELGQITQRVFEQTSESESFVEEIGKLVSKTGGLKAAKDEAFRHVELAKHSLQTWFRTFQSKCVSESFQAESVLAFQELQQLADFILTRKN